MSALHSTSKVLRLKEVCALTGLSKSAIYDKGCKSSKYFDPTFAVRFKLSARAVGWDASEVTAWVQNQKDKRHQLER